MEDNDGYQINISANNNLENVLMYIRGVENVLNTYDQSYSYLLFFISELDNICEFLAESFTHSIILMLTIICQRLLSNIKNQDRKFNCRHSDGNLEF